MSSQLRPLVLWIGPNTGQLIEDASDLDPYAAVGMSLVGLEHHASALARAAALKRDLFLDSESWRNQLDPENPLRVRLPPALRWDPAFELGRASSTAIEEFAERYTDAHVERQGSWLASPGHLILDGFAATGGLCDARQTELALAHAVIENVRSRGPVSSPTNPRPRRAIATIAVNLAPLSPVLVRGLVDAYAECDADAYVIRIWNFNPSATQFTLLRGLARRLQERSGRPCLLDGVGRLAFAALRAEIGGAIVGYGRGVIAPRRQAAEAEAREGDDAEEARGIPLYAPQILGGIPLGPTYDGLRTLLMAELDCECGAHPRGRPPSTQAEQLQHNLHWERIELTAAIEPSRASRDAFAARVSRVSKRRRLSGLGELAGAWKVAVEPGARDDRVSARLRLTL